MGFQTAQMNQWFHSISGIHTLSFMLLPHVHLYEAGQKIPKGAELAIGSSTRQPEMLCQ